jgi:chitodextrinase
LSWTASTDAVGVTGYRIYRAGTQIGTSATNSYTDTGLTVGTSYSYTVSAYDAAGNTSAQSSSVSGTTLSNPDTTSPTVSILNPSSGTFTGNITFSASASDPTVAGQTLSGLKTLTLYIDGSVYATSSSGSISKTLDTTTLTNASHTLTAQATDNAGNNSTIASVTITVNNAPATKYPRTITLTSLEGLSAIPNNQSITVTVLSGSTVLETQNLTPNASKQYTVSFLSSDPQLVDIRVKVNNYLSAKLSAIDTTINNPSSLTVNPLLAGDINNDNTINSLDYSSLNSNWLKTTSTGDLNNDGIVNSFDFAILKNNWGKVGQ